MEALYAPHRPNAGWQSEEQFSDGTLRLLGLLWSLQDGNALLLLEEPEISLNDAIVKKIPLILDRLQRDRKTRRQIVVSTHSEALLGNPGIDVLPPFEHASVMPGRSFMCSVKRLPAVDPDSRALLANTPIDSRQRRATAGCANLPAHLDRVEKKPEAIEAPGS